MRLHVQHVANVAGADPPQHLNKRRRMAAIETNAHGDLRPAARIYRLLGTGAGQGQRFFDIGMFAGFGSGNNLFMVFCMRGGQHRGIDLRIPEHLFVCGNHRDAVFFGILGVVCGIAEDGLDDTDFAAVLHRLGEAVAPATKPVNSCFQHADPYLFRLWLNTAISLS